MTTFTDAQKEQIRRYLGYSALETSQLNTACTRLEQASAPAVGTVQSLLRSIARVEQQVRSDRPFVARTSQSNAGGFTQMSPAVRMQAPKMEAQRLTDELARTLQLPVKAYVLGGGGFSSQGRLRRG
jgi:hypothetical protein